MLILMNSGSVRQPPTKGSMAFTAGKMLEGPAGWSQVQLAERIPEASLQIRPGSAERAIFIR